MVLALGVIVGLAVLLVAEALLFATQRLDRGFGATLRSRQARTKGLGTPHEGCLRRGHVVRNLEWSSTDRHQPSPAVDRVVGLGCRYRYRGNRISDPLLRTMPPLWLHHRISESTVASKLLREVQNAFSLARYLVGEVVMVGLAITEQRLRAVTTVTTALLPHHKKPHFS